MEYVILIVSLAGVVLGADFLVGGSVSLARRFKVSDFVIGAAIIGVGTSFPELIVSLVGAIEGNSDVAIGNVVGSNIFNVLGILGLTALMFPVSVTRSNLRYDLPYCIGASLLLLLLAFNFFIGGEAGIGRIDGLVLLACFAFYMWNSFRGGSQSQPGPEEKPETRTSSEEKLWPAILKIVGGLGVLVIGSYFFVEEAVVIAGKLGVDDAFISITLIACGTSLPELAAAIAAALKKNTQMALGNIVGSNIFNILLILGLGSVVSPLTSGGITLVDYLVMIGAAVLLLLLGLKGRITRVGGAFMFVCFIVYNWYLLSAQMGAA